MSWFEIFSLFTIVLSASLLVVTYVKLVRANRRLRKYDGYLDVSEQDASQIHQLEIVTPPEKLKDMDVIVFKVRKVVEGE